jgi:hypothetical protein
MLACASWTLSLVKLISRRLGFESYLENADLAPQSGHVSNFWDSVDPLIETADVHCFQIDSSAPPTLVHGGHLVWTRLELAGALTKGPLGNER